MRAPLIAGNWKMNTTIAEAIDLVTQMQPLIEPIRYVEKVICPPFVSLSAVGEILKGSSVKIGAQNVFYEETGAFTGEVSPLMLSGLCEYVILGHSERRQYFNETSEIVNKKVLAALKTGINPILCVGENLMEYDSGKTEEVVTGQVKNSLKNVNITEKLVLAYEPVWAIGTGKAANGARANYVIGLIRETIAGMSNYDLARQIRLIYGGSVTAANIGEFISQPEIDGGLVGGSSLKIEQFISIMKQTAQLKKSPVI